jgi:hypothetical protein
MLRVFTHVLRELSLNEELAVTDLLQVHEQSVGLINAQPL